MPCQLPLGDEGYAGTVIRYLAITWYDRTNSNYIHTWYLDRHSESPLIIPVTRYCIIIR